MATRITSLPIFLGAGIGLPVAVALVVAFRRRGWLTADGTVPPAIPADRPHLTRQQRWHLLHPMEAPQSP